jgi:hypothetical protein
VLKNRASRRRRCAAFANAHMQLLDAWSAKLEAKVMVSASLSLESLQLQASSV